MAVALTRSREAAAAPLRILMVSDVYLPRINGVSTSIAIFRAELERLGHEVDLLVPAYGDTRDALAVDPGVHRVRGWAPWFDPEDKLMSARKLRALRPRLAGAGYDLIHVQTPFRAHQFGVALACQLGIPVIESYHTLFEAYFEHYLPWLPRAWLRAAARAFSRRQCNVVDAVIVPSAAMAESLSGYRVHSPVHILPTGLESAAFAPADGRRFRARIGLDDETPLLLFVGRVAHEKNIDFLLHMLRALLTAQPQVQLAIVGDGPARKSLERLGRRLGVADHLHWTGYVPRTGLLRDAYHGADGFVFASQTETQGLVLLEAMAQGLPCVAVAAHGTCDLLEEGAGALIAPLDPEGFAARVAELLADGALRSQLGHAARSHAAQWSAPAAARRLDALYRGQLASRLAMT